MKITNIDGGVFASGGALMVYQGYQGQMKESDMGVGFLLGALALAIHKRGQPAIVDKQTKQALLFCNLTSTISPQIQDHAAQTGTSCLLDEGADLLGGPRL